MIPELQQALASPNLQAFLRVIRAGETSQTDDAYRMMFGGGLFDGFDAHPNRAITRGALTSTAAGAYQFLYRTWVECRTALSLPDFSPQSQDLAAAFLIRRRGALPDVLAGRIPEAIAKCCREWASLPGSPYGQPTRTMAQALATYAQYGGSLDTSAPPVQKPAESVHITEPTMPLPAIIGALLPSLVQAIPTLGKLFGSGSEVAERNVKAAELAMQIAQDTLGATNAQEAVEKAKADPVAAAAVGQAIEARWLELTEAGGDGIAGARKADTAAVQAGGGVWWHSPSLLIAGLLVPLVYLLVLSLIGMIGTATWSDDVRAGLAGSLISAIVGGLVGYYYGQTTSRNRTPAAQGSAT